MNTKPDAVEEVKPRDECYVCHKAEEDDPEVELRRYGTGGAWLCFDCMIADPVKEAEAHRQFGAQLDAAGPVAVLTREGPVPHRSLGKKLS